MKVTVQTMKIPRFQIEVNPDDKLLDLKKKLEEVLGEKDFPASTQNLRYKGQRLATPNSTLRELNVNEQGVIGVSAIPKRRPLLPHEIPRFKENFVAAARARSKVDGSKAKMNNYVAAAPLFMCKDSKFGIKVYTRRKNLNGKLVK